MRKGLFVAAAALLLSASVAARADVIYSITVIDLGSKEDGTFTFDETSILTSDTTISTGITTSGPAITSIYINPLNAGGTCPGTAGSCVTIDYTKSGTFSASFYDALNSTGSVTDTIETVTITNSVAATPEPSSIALLGTGLLGVMGVVRRRVFA